MPGLQWKAQGCRGNARVAMEGTGLQMNCQGCNGRHRVADELPGLQWKAQCCSGNTRVAKEGTVLQWKYQGCKGRHSVAGEAPGLPAKELACKDREDGNQIKSTTRAIASGLTGRQEGLLAIPEMCFVSSSIHSCSLHLPCHF
ncbi:hypothetical protein Pmani_039769 [Petrolisthes manimaculis]|uniref:Uncharacterized protein n=1 Tax=Petrolisthes manimaculis TaxID=1843537 RepID=A0AAE1ND33_9EUCA|nr:hypothetical protein Pmani_039769 [Petrolisthes manimaculis]